MARLVEPAPRSRRNSGKPHAERRQSERAVVYWDQKAAEFGSRPTLTRLEPGANIDDGDWPHRFVIAPDRLRELSSFLMCGSSAARLLELADGPVESPLMFRKMPRKYLQIFTWGCNKATASGLPTRLAGAVDRGGGRRQLYRAVFIPVGVNLVFGAFGSTLKERQSGSGRRLEDPFIGQMLRAIREIQTAGIISLGAIAAALNERGVRTLRGHNWTAATVRNLLLRTSQ
jgi:hypothetical protein